MTETEAGETDRFSTWDGAYVLGALIPEERREYEAHLAECPSCRAAVAEIAMLPSLLARVPEADVASFDELADLPPLPDSLRQPPAELLAPPAELLGRVLRDDRRQVRRRWVRQVAIGVGSAVVAAAAAVAIVIPMIRTSNPAPTQPNVFAARTMKALVAAPVTADFTVFDLGNGTTHIAMNCEYADSQGPSYTNAYRMVVTTTSGSTEQVSRWIVQPGQQKYHPSGNIDMAPEKIRSVSITDDEGTPLMVGTV